MNITKPNHFAFVLVFLFWSVTALMVQAQQTPQVTPVWYDFFGTVVWVDGSPADPGTRIEVYDPDGVLCGATTVTTAGYFGFMPVYQDDPFTAADEGAVEGDTLTITIHGLPREGTSALTWRPWQRVRLNLTAVTAVASEPRAEAPETFTLEQNYPNPFNPGTTIRYTVPPGIDAQPVRLAIYDIRGRMVRTLLEQPQSPGIYAVEWDGRTDAGGHLASGVYLYRLHIGPFTASKKMLLLK